MRKTRKAWFSVGPGPNWHARAITAANRAGAAVFHISTLLGNSRADAARALVEKKFGAGAVARMAAEMAEEAGYGRVLFVWNTEDEREALLSCGAIQFPEGGDEHAFDEGEDAVNGVFYVTCMGERHAVEVCGFTMRALDHAGEELDLLLLIGEDSPCLALDGEPADLASADWENTERVEKILEKADILHRRTMAVLERSTGKWVLSVRPRLYGKPVEGVEPVRIAFGDGKAEGFLRTAAGKISDRMIVWSPAAPLVATLAVRDAVAERAKTVRLFAGRCARVEAEDV